MFKKKKEEGKEVKTRKRQLEEILELPKEAISNQPRLTMVGFEQLLLENYKGILEYEEFFIKISTHIGTIHINGFHLALEQLTTDDIMITGKIESMELESNI